MNLQKAMIYLNAFGNTLKDFGRTKKDPKGHVQRAVFYGISYSASIGKTSTDYLQLKDDFKLYSIINELVATLSPSEFIEVFPIKKDFKSGKFGSKDYFYTMDYLAIYEMNKPIGDKATEFLWEYQNSVVGEYVIQTMLTMNRVLKFEGKKTLTDEACDMLEIKRLTAYEDNSGNRFTIDESGRTSKLSEKKQRMPKYLKLVK